MLSINGRVASVRRNGRMKLMRQRCTHHACKNGDDQNLYSCWDSEAPGLFIGLIYAWNAIKGIGKRQVDQSMFVAFRNHYFATHNKGIASNFEPESISFCLRNMVKPRCVLWNGHKLELIPILTREWWGVKSQEEADVFCISRFAWGPSAWNRTSLAANSLPGKLGIPKMAAFLLSPKDAILILEILYHLYLKMAMSLSKIGTWMGKKS